MFRDLVDMARAAGKRVIHMARFPRLCEHQFELESVSDDGVVQVCPKCDAVNIACFNPMMVPVFIDSYYR